MPWMIRLYDNDDDELIAEVPLRLDEKRGSTFLVAADDWTAYLDWDQTGQEEEGLKT